MEKVNFLGVEANCGAGWDGFHIFNVLLITGIITYALFSLWYVILKSQKSMAYRVFQAILSLIIIVPLSIALAFYIKIITC